ncbi:MAG: hypothetical protein ACFCUO_10485 [Rhodospirillales bacterium]
MIRRFVGKFFFGDESTADPLQYGLIVALVSTSAAAVVAVWAIS